MPGEEKLTAEENLANSASKNNGSIAMTGL